MQQIGEWISQSGLTRSEVARRAGVARSTLDRIENGTGGPNLATLEDIAAACGLHFDIVARHAAEPAAAEAARLLLEVDYSPADHAGAAKWYPRLERAVTNGGEVSALMQAAHASNLRLRDDVTSISGALTVLNAASAGDGSGGRYALSGAPGLGMVGTVVLWVERADVAARLLKETASHTSAAPTTEVLVVPANIAVFTGSFPNEGVTLAAPIQIMLDCIGLGGALEQAALKEVRTW